jgi:hypothetical protein
VYLGADMVRDEPDDTLAVVSRKALASIGEARAEPIDPKPSVGVEHDLDDGRFVEPGRDFGPKRGDEHASAARLTFGLEVGNGH